jgi:hypothetical protein
VDVTVNGQPTCVGSGANDCQLEVDSTDKIVFRITPDIASNFAQITLPDSSQALAAIPPGSKMKADAAQNFGIDLRNPQQVLYKNTYPYIRSMTTALGTNRACAQSIGAFNTIALQTTPNSFQAGNYLDNLLKSYSSIAGCTNTTYLHIASPGKSYKIQVTRSSNTPVQGDYVDYMFYVAGHFDPLNPNYNNYPGSHKTVRLIPTGG